MLDQLVDAIGSDGVQDCIARSGRDGKARFLEVLEKDFDLSIRELEDNAQHHQDSSEDALTRILVGPLRLLGYDAKSDPNTRGHVDILVESRRLNLKWIGEAKKHAGYDKDVEGVLQLITRYTSGADDHGAVVLYVFNRNAARMTAEWRTVLTDEPRCETIRLIDDARTVFRFRSVHRHPSGIEYMVRHHIVLLHHDPQDASGRGRGASSPPAPPPA